MKSVAFHTLGCRVNQYETEAIAESFERKGYKVVDYGSAADIYVVNTCTVTNIADKKSRQILTKARRLNPDALVVAVGCYAQIAEKELAKHTDIDLVIGNNNKADIIDIVEKYFGESKNKSYVKALSEQKEYEDLYITRNENKSKAYVKVQDGCNQFCSYCIIPYTRGSVRSRKPEHIIREIKNIAENGYKQIVLTGIHIASYGEDLEKYTLIDLIEQINPIDGIEGIGIGSIAPKLLTRDFVNRLKTISKIIPSFHVSLQSGCDETLKRMNRRYTTDQYYKGIEKLREVFSHPTITTDIIVGFPGETEKEFEETMEFVKKVRFQDLHVFKYSIREGTKAAQMENQVNGEVKNKRSKMLINLVQNMNS